MELSLLFVFIKMSACIVRQELDNIAEGTWVVMAIGKLLFISCVIFHSQCSAKCKFVTELQCVTCEISMMVRLVGLKYFTTILIPIQELYLMYNFLCWKLFYSKV